MDDQKRLCAVKNITDGIGNLNFWDIQFVMMNVFSLQNINLICQGKKTLKGKPIPYTGGRTHAGGCLGETWGFPFLCSAIRSEFNDFREPYAEATGRPKERRTNKPLPMRNS
jgi:hypothetical protein